MTEWLSYQETLTKVEDFMVKSGIRKYCTEICKGQCCAGCYGSARACHKNGPYKKEHKEFMNGRLSERE